MFDFFQQADKDDLILVAGGGGFIGGHMIADLRRAGYRRLRAVDIKPVENWHLSFPDVDNQVLDLREKPACMEAAKDAAWIYNFACDMGGMGFIEFHKADCMLSVLINTHMLMAAREVGAKRMLYSSSACVYAADKQTDADVTALKESDAYPAMAEDGYGWEKLFSERMCRHFYEDYGVDNRVVRFHNVYGPDGSWNDGREKAPAAISRKVALAKLTGDHSIEIWGDGLQTRSFMYIDDCLEGTKMMMASDVREPLNVGSDELVTINGLVDMVESFAGIKLERHYNLDAPKGVRGRNSDNTLIQEKLGWAPSIPLVEGMEKTYRWVYDQVKASL
ncbi:NAD-dependent epimerase/dehydratase family protein [Magnetospira sp. QH-2]|uniref:NAD-dependent epimerase/dehydratase family protein n=1 Tax=Magnetospira sp. (strain QH-2) TaxID=1288970 RepID=UPI0003E81BDE|nr:NAD-dependent epimerase/dehydratase family protein [Magnetospira sp. QH-2]CCQ74180.1 GDP-mannose 3,5-epimerase 1 [Magnetospira sp. QH-2]